MNTILNLQEHKVESVNTLRVKLEETQARASTKNKQGNRDTSAAPSNGTTASITETNLLDQGNKEILVSDPAYSSDFKRLYAKDLRDTCTTQLYRNNNGTTTIIK